MHRFSAVPYVNREKKEKLNYKTTLSGGTSVNTSKKGWPNSQQEVIKNSSAVYPTRTFKFAERRPSFLNSHKSFRPSPSKKANKKCSIS